MFFVAKFLISGLTIAFASWLAGKKPILAGFIIGLPLMSMLSLSFSYFEYRDMDKINQFALAIVVAVPLSMTFFVPFLLNKWLRWDFALSFLSGVALLIVVYFLHSLLLKS